MPSPLGDKIRALRKEKKLSLERLAELTESSKSYIWELENKDDPKPSAEKIGKIASVLEVTTEFLLTDSQRPLAKRSSTRPSSASTKACRTTPRSGYARSLKHGMTTSDPAEAANCRGQSHLVNAQHGAGNEPLPGEGRRGRPRATRSSQGTGTSVD